jgi:hypothetical protein
MMLLAIGSGLHHLPDGTVPDEVLKQVKSGIRNAYDFLVAGGQVRAVSLLVAAQLADSELKPAGIPINYRPPFRFEAGHDSNQLSAGFRL